MARNDPENQVIWQDPENEKFSISLSNGILKVFNGNICRLIACRDLVQREHSAYAPTLTVPIGAREGAKAFHYGEMHEALCALFGVDHAKGVRYGLDGFYHFGFKDLYREDDYERLTNGVVEILSAFRVKPDTRVERHPGCIEVIINVDPSGR